MAFEVQPARSPGGRRARRLGRLLLFPPIQRAWGLAFGVTGLALRPRRKVAGWSPAGGRVLVVAPHPDDETIGCGGTIVLHGRHGDEVGVVIVTDGGASRPASREVRAAEAREAATVLGGDWQMLQIAEEDRALEEVARERLSAVLAEFQPAVLYAPSCIDYHPVHARVGLALSGALVSREIEPRVRVYEIGVPLTPVLATLLVDVGPAAALKLLALATYASQQNAIEPIRRLHGYNRRLYRARDEVELFWEMPAQTYVGLMAAGDWTSGRSPFRGVRERPPSDALPYLTGLRERARLRWAAAERDQAGKSKNIRTTR